MDGGVRSGQDVVKASALGAKMSLIGRPWVYAVAAKGETGVTQLLQIFKGEMNVSMALTAAPKLNQLTQEIIKSVDS